MNETKLLICLFLTGLSALVFLFLWLVRVRAAATEADARAILRERLDAANAAKATLAQEAAASSLALTALRSQLASAHSARNRAWRKPEKRLSDADVRRAFAVADDAPLWLALHQTLDDYILTQVDDVSLPPSATMTAETRTHVAGGLEHVRLLQRQLLELHRAAQTLDADLEGEGPEKGGVS